MPKDIKKWKDRSLANGTTFYPKDWITIYAVNQHLQPSLQSGKSLEEWGNYPASQYVVIGRVPTALELQDFS